MSNTRVGVYADVANLYRNGGTRNGGTRAQYDRLQEFTVGESDRGDGYQALDIQLISRLSDR